MSDDLKRRARELYDTAENAVDDEEVGAAEYEAARLLPTLLARIEALEAERDEAKANQAGEHVLKMRVDIADIRVRLAKYERVVALAREWSVRGVWSAAQELHDAIDALDPKEATDGY